MSLDIQSVRSRFPALQETVDGKQVVFLDNPAGTQMPQQVIDAITDCLVHYNVNTEVPYGPGDRVTAMTQEARRAAAEFLGSETPDEIAFGNNMTSLAVLLSRSLVHEIKPGDEIVVSHMEHDGNVGPWVLMAEDAGATVRWIDIDPVTYAIDVEDAAVKITPKTKFVALSYAGNGTGSINDVSSVIRLAKAQGAWTFIDAVQYAPHGLVDVTALDCDFLSCSAYKFYGTQVGILYGKQELMKNLRAYTVRPSLSKVPSRWEPGTKNYEGLVGVLAAIDYIAEQGVLYGGATSDAGRRDKLKAAWPVLAAYEQQLAEHLVDGLQAIPGVQIYGIANREDMAKRVATVSFRKEGCTPQQLTETLGAEQIGSRCGDYLAVALIDRLGLQDSGGLTRLGPVHYNTTAEIDRALEVIESA
ncbi:MAG: cysteine desulfurase-like protein [Gemmatimonadota bacterium]|nr:cysteine desulfurase-like protein [Gemmatimonadota bacterium]